MGKIGNKYWQFRNKHGRNYKYTPKRLWDEFVNYAEWLEENPLQEAMLVPRGIKTKGTDGNEKTIHKIAMPKMRAMTLTGFCIYADIELSTFEDYRKNKDFYRVTTRIDEIIKTQKFEGAAAGLLNPNIIARDLGLVDNVKKESEKTEKIIFEFGGTGLSIDDFEKKENE